ncbi:MAG: DNA polymerase III subunit beta [Halofilum sp. (in: g-proteobacteria)]|nr:DNA polymerase III subunit beta [Halofilum sp. (in: g-proteobacteria)]
MKLEIAREALLKPLQQVIGAVERRQTLPALGNVLVSAGEEGLQLAATDLEIELRAEVGVAVEQAGETTVAARKLLDICRTLPTGASVRLEQDGERVTVRSGRSRFTLATLPASEFPLIDDVQGEVDFTLGQAELKHAIERIGFAMAQQDVRYYLNGLLLELAGDRLRTVATDGHRLSLCETPAELPAGDGQQVIVPRKGVNELARLLDEQAEEPARIRIGGSHVQVSLPGLRFTSKLIDGRFPDYTRVVPEGGSNELRGDRETLRQALARTSILSNEKYKGVRLGMGPEGLRIQTHNPDQEEAEEEVEVSYEGEPLEIGFNVVYLLDILGSLEGDEVRAQFNDSNSSVLITDPAADDCRHVVMPMRL